MKQEFLLWAGIQRLGLRSLPVKLVAQILVVAGNYVISKWVVFRRGKDTLG